VPPDVKPVPPPDVKPRLPKLEDEEDEDAAGVPPFVPPPLVFVPPPFVFVPPPPPPRPRYGAGLGSNRQERKFNFYMGVPDYPPDVLCGPPPPASFCDIEIHKAPAFKVAFKHGMKPTPPQLQVMETEAAALMSGRREHVIVEAPTGTGKTIACLTPLLHYQAQQFELYGVIDPARPPRIIYVARTLSQLDNTMKEIASMPYAALIAAPVSKEHLCLQPREEGMSAADLCTKMCKPLSARDQEEMPGRKTYCEFLDKQNEVDLPASRILDYFTGGALAGNSIEEIKEKAAGEGVCAYHITRDVTQTNGGSVLALTYPQLFDPHLRACNKTDMLLKNSIVIIDEAHNTPGVCRDVASESLNMKQLLDLRDESQKQKHALEDLLQTLRLPGFKPANEYVKEGLVRSAIAVVEAMQRLIGFLIDWLQATSQGTRPGLRGLSWELVDLTQTASLSGSDAQQLIIDALVASECMRDPALPAASAGVPAGAAAALPSPAASPAASPAPSPAASPAPSPAAPPAPALAPAAVRALRASHAHEALEELGDVLHVVDAALKEANYRSASTSATSSAHRRPSGRFGSLLAKLSICVGSNADAFALMLRRLSPRGVKEERSKPPGLRDSPLPELHIACLSAAVAMKRITDLAQCVVFASGTLGPAEDFASEIGLQRYRAVSTEHHASVKTQLLPVVYTGGPGRPMRITSTNLKLCQDMPIGGPKNMMDEAADVLLRCALHVPGGILFFFPSKTTLRIFMDRWTRDGTLAKLKAMLPHANALIIDDAEAAEESRANVERYCTFASRASTNGGPTAIMFTVLRGRASEGADFKDSLARAVILLGLPMLPCKDPSVMAKMAYNERMAPGSGDRWYQSEAVRCAAQAVGRVIRHAGDFGVVVLLDCRYAPRGPGRVDSINHLLPKYLRGLIQTDSSPDAVAAKLQPFFARCAALPAPPPSGVKLEVKQER